jgi:ABC-type dipeptide/oligopeptide/nickel transport system permease component
MTTFIIRRIIWTIPVILFVIFMVFIMMRQIGGNPFRVTERNVPEAIQRNLERKYHLDEPWYVQYAYYVEGVFTYDLGPSMRLRTRDVNDIIEQHFPTSLQLGLYAFIWAVIVGIPLGVLAALKPNSIFDYGAMFFSNVGFALPNFLVATLLIYYFAVQWDLVPTNGWPHADGIAQLWTVDARVILPVFALGLFPLAYFARLVRGSMLETMQQDYVRTARAKGLRRTRIIGLHVLKNSMIPAITATAPLLGLIITGTFVIEIIFSIPGIGRYFVQSVFNRDFSVVMGVTVLTSIVVIIANLFVDIMYGFLDPRTRDVRT